MERREFLKKVGLGTGIIITAPVIANQVKSEPESLWESMDPDEEWTAGDGLDIACDYIGDNEDHDGHWNSFHALSETKIDSITASDGNKDDLPVELPFVAGTFICTGGAFTSIKLGYGQVVMNRI